MPDLEGRPPVIQEACDGRRGPRGLESALACRMLSSRIDGVSPSLAPNTPWSQTDMHATFPQGRRFLTAGLPGTVWTLRVAGRQRAVRSYPVLPIDELFGLEDGLEAATGLADDAGVVADMLESRMIASPRPRRRRDRTVSSRAALYAPSR